MPENTPKYTNPSALALIARMVRKQNTQLLDEYGARNSFSPKEIIALKKDLIKLNHVFPNVVQKKYHIYLGKLELEQFLKDPIGGSSLPYLLQEDGFYILQEDGSKIYL